MQPRFNSRQKKEQRRVEKSEVHSAWQFVPYANTENLKKKRSRRSLNSLAPQIDTYLPLFPLWCIQQALFFILNFCHYKKKKKTLTMGGGEEGRKGYIFTPSTLALIISSWFCLVLLFAFACSCLPACQLPASPVFRRLKRFILRSCMHLSPFFLHTLLPPHFQFNNNHNPKKKLAQTKASLVWVLCVTVDPWLTIFTCLIDRPIASLSNCAMSWETSRSWVKIRGSTYIIIPLSFCLP